MGYYGSVGDFYGRPAGDGSAEYKLALARRAASPIVRTAPQATRWFPSVGSSSLVTGAKAAYRGAKAIGSMVFDGGSQRTYRRMNPLNPRALRRALRRAQSFERFAKSCIRVTHSKGRSKWKFGRKRRR